MNNNTIGPGHTGEMFSSYLPVGLLLFIPGHKMHSQDLNIFLANNVTADYFPLSGRVV